MKAIIHNLHAFGLSAEPSAMILTMPMNLEVSMSRLRGLIARRNKARLLRTRLLKQIEKINEIINEIENKLAEMERIIEAGGRLE